VTVCAAVGLSLFVALTLDPMLSARFSAKRDAKAPQYRGLKRPFEWVHSQIDQTYRSILYFSVRHKLSVGVLTVGTLFLSVFLMGKTGQDFMNAEDHGQFMLEAELPAGTALAETARVSRAVEEELLAQREFRTLVATIGPAGQGNVVKWLVLTSDKQERKLSLNQLKGIARGAASKMRGARVSVMEPPMFEGAAAEAPIVIRVRGEEYASLLSAAKQVEASLRETRGVSDVQLRYSPGRPELSVALDRVRAAGGGVSASDIASALRVAIAGEEAGTLRQPDQHRDVPIRVRLGRRDRGDAASLAAITLQTPGGRVPVSEFVRFARSDGPQVIERQNKSREITIWATPNGRALGDVAAEFRPRIAKLSLPEGVSVAYDGALRMMDENNQGVGLALLLGVAFIYIVLASQFESFLHPLTIMVTLPLAMVGAIMALYLTRSTLALSALIGMILLIGLVTKNAILLVDRAIVHVREHGATPMSAILAAGSERLRPILMTSAAMIFGMLPTALATGAASETRAPMGIAIVGGVISSTALSLIVVPVVYLTFEGAKAWIARRLTSWQSVSVSDEEPDSSAPAETSGVSSF
jgi:hydrophobic/amphiphilic exporter-1 (mainly G- bacteria), HAE1 family